jgi:hypothetical protein
MFVLNVQLHAFTNAAGSLAGKQVRAAQALQKGQQRTERNEHFPSKSPSADSTTRQMYADRTTCMFCDYIVQIVCSAKPCSLKASHLKPQLKWRNVSWIDNVRPIRLKQPKTHDFGYLYTGVLQKRMTISAAKREWLSSNTLVSKSTAIPAQHHMCFVNTPLEV